MTQPAVTTMIWRGTPLRDHLLAQARDAVAAMGRPVKLAIVQVGHDAPSSAYVRHKLAACAAAGIVGEHIRLRGEEGEAALASLIHALGHDPQVQGIIVQTPLPFGWNVRAALDAVPAQKDVDGLGSANIALRRAGDGQALMPATPLGILRILGSLGVAAEGKAVAVIGKGMVVGAPLREMLAAAGAEVVGIDKDTHAPARLCRGCDILIAAAGSPALVGRDWVKPGAVVIDVGISRREDAASGKAYLAGDVHRLEVEGLAGVLTPVPGGVGPITVATLLTNVVDATRLQMAQPKAVWRLDAPGAQPHPCGQ